MKSYAQHGTPDYDAKTAAGCLEDGEPTFLLRAQDIHAGDTVRAWAAMVNDPAMREEAEAIARLMDNWPTKKEPD